MLWLEEEWWGPVGSDGAGSHSSLPLLLLLLPLCARAAWEETGLSFSHGLFEFSLESSAWEAAQPGRKRTQLPFCWGTGQGLNHQQAALSPSVFLLGNVQFKFSSSLLMYLVQLLNS